MHRTRSPRSLSSLPLPAAQLLLAALATSACGETAALSAADAAVASAADTRSPDLEAPPTSDVSEPAEDAATRAPSDSEGPPPAGAGRCLYTNPFSQGAECKRYVGAEWTPDTAAADCAAVLPGTAGTYDSEAACDAGATLGDCAIDGPQAYVLTSAGDDAGQCDLARLGCETFAKGRFVASPLCDDGVVTPPDTDPPPEGPDWGTSPFLQPYEVCVEPLPGEPPGATDGEVCTFMAISACTEPGRRYDQYINCGEVRTQRPYYGFEVPPKAPADDPRLEDAAYMGEVAWLKTQVEACACVCCHAAGTAPKGPSGWSIDAGPLWIDTIPNSGLAMLAGLVDSTAFGAFDPSQNNGFSRTETGLPTTDVARMKAFLTGEFERRGFAVADAANYPPFGGPLYKQSIAELPPCANGEGVDASGQLTWTGGGARYVYVLNAGSANPGVPPNLDVPEGTRWFFEVGAKDQPIPAPQQYGQLPATARQRVPASGAPAPLVPGDTYVVYALFDIGVPLTACTFVAP